MIERQHTVRLAAAEGRLQLDDRLAALPRDALQRLHQQFSHAGGDIGSREELHRVLILDGCRSARHLREVCGKLCVAVGPVRHVRVGLNHLAPAWQTGIRLAKHLHAVLLVERSLRFRNELLYGGGTIGRPVADGTYHCGEPCRAVRIKPLAETRHRVQRAVGVLLTAILRAFVGSFIPGSLQFLAPIPIIDWEFAPEDVIP